MSTIIACLLAYLAIGAVVAAWVLHGDDDRRPLDYAGLGALWPLVVLIGFCLQVESKRNAR